MTEIRQVIPLYAVPAAQKISGVGTRLLGLIKRVARAVAAFFASFSCFKSMKNVFTSREITLLRDSDSRPSEDSPSLTDRKITPVKSPPNTKADNYTQQEPPYTSFDPQLESLRGFFRQFAQLSIDEIYDKDLAKHVEEIQKNASAIPPKIKWLASLLVETGDKASKPLFQKFSQQKAQKIDPALEMIFKTLLKGDPLLWQEALTKHLYDTLSQKTLPQGILASHYVDPILQGYTAHEEWPKCIDEMLIKNPQLDKALLENLIENSKTYLDQLQRAERSGLYTFLERRLADEFKNIKLPATQNLERDYIHTILNWLLLSNRAIPLAELFGPGDAHKENTIDKIFERAIELIVEKKIDQYARLVERTMQHRLGQIARNMLKINAGRMADYFSERLADLVNEMPFTDTFDAIVQKAGANHIDAVIKAEKFRNEHAKLLEKSKRIALLTPQDADEVKAQADAKKYLEDVRMHGGDDAFLHYKFLEKYSTQKGCNPKIKHLIDHEIALARKGGDPSFDRKVNEREICETLAETMMDLMLPVKKTLGPNGKIEEIDPFTVMWERLYFPEELRSVIKHFEKLTDEFATPDTAGLIDKFRLPALDFVKMAFKALAKDALKKHLIQVVQKGFDKFTDPAALDTLNVDSTFPSFNMQLVRQFIRQEMGYHLGDFAPLFHKLVSEGDAQRTVNIETLHNALEAMARKHFKSFNPDTFYTVEIREGDQSRTEQRKLTPDDWKRLTLATVTTIENEIINAKINGTPFDPETCSVEDVRDIMKTSYQETSKSNHPVWGNMAMDLLFGIGNFPYEGVLTFFIKDATGRALTNSTKEMRKSHHYLVGNAAESLKQSWLLPTKIKNLFATNTEAPVQHTAVRLDEQIAVTSALAHDLLRRMADQKNAMIRYAMKKVLTNQPGVINRQVSLIYKKLWGKQILNGNLLVTFCDEIFRSMGTAAETIRLRDNIRAIPTP